MALMTEMESLLGAGGEFSRVMEGFESREGQVQMARAVAETIACKGVAGKGIACKGALLVEAGTGTGKTLGYLVPAVLSGKKVVISTGTKNLQEQIIDKDMPLVRKVLPGRFRSALMKGRGNYLCQRRFKNFSQQPLFATSREGAIFMAIQDWAMKTKTGDRAEMDFLPDDYFAWNDINSRTELCLGSACPSYSSCFVGKMRADAAMADIVVVNHHLFFADLNARHNSFGEVIPRYDAVIFDEAHLIEEIATTYFGYSLSSYRIKDAVNDAQRELATHKLAGKDALRLLENIVQRANRLFNAIMGRENVTKRLRKQTRNLWADSADALMNSLNLATDHMDSLKNPPDPVKAIATRFAEIAGLVMDIRTMDKDENVYWAEARGKGVILRSSPIDVSAHLREKLYPKVEACVFTSATLSSDGDFSFISSRLGLTGHKELSIDSPFDYKNQTVFYLPTDLPEPNDYKFADMAAERIYDLLMISNGRAFALFTSRANMEKCWDTLKDRLPFTVLKQGENPRSVTLKKFREDTHSVLFATISFWQGVDVTGESLSAVIIDKLPFAMPDDPLVSARIEFIRKHAGSPFMQYQVPSAALLLKQGLGRLIRSASDRGLLAVLDKRMKTKSYGAAFFKVLPEIPVITQIGEVEKNVIKWWGKRDEKTTSPR